MATEFTQRDYARFDIAPWPGERFEVQGDVDTASGMRHCFKVGIFGTLAAAKQFVADYAAQHSINEAAAVWRANVL